jgi:hypothetical protein
MEPNMFATPLLSMSLAILLLLLLWLKTGAQAAANAAGKGLAFAQAATQEPALNSCLPKAPSSPVAMTPADSPTITPPEATEARRSKTHTLNSARLQEDCSTV